MVKSYVVLMITPSVSPRDHIPPDVCSGLGLGFCAGSINGPLCAETAAARVNNTDSRTAVRHLSMSVVLPSGAGHDGPPLDKISDSLEPLAESGSEPTVAFQYHLALGNRIRHRQATRHDEGQSTRVTTELDLSGMV